MPSTHRWLGCITHYDSGQMKLLALSLIATGANNQEIAEILSISRKTVKNHVSNILSRLEMRDLTQAALFASLFFTSKKQI